MGQQLIARWNRQGKIQIVVTPDVRSTQEIINYLRKYVPRNLLVESSHRQLHLFQSLADRELKYGNQNMYQTAYFRDEDYNDLYLFDGGKVIPVDKIKDRSLSYYDSWDDLLSGKKSYSGRGF